MTNNNSLEDLVKTFESLDQILTPTGQEATENMTRCILVFKKKGFYSYCCMFSNVKIQAILDYHQLSLRKTDNSHC